MNAMYRGIPFSPRTALAVNLGEADTVIPVEDVSAFPPAPNYATIGTDEGAETVFYTALTERALSGCTRGVEGMAKAWEAGEVVARNFTAADHAALVENVGELDGVVAGHLEDGASHVTQEEKAAWSAKETPEEAQRKADAAEEAAKSASRPRGWVPAAAEVTGLPGEDYATSRVRGISAGTNDLSAGESVLESGTIYLVYG